MFGPKEEFCFIWSTLEFRGPAVRLRGRQHQQRSSLVLRLSSVHPVQLLHKRPTDLHRESRRKKHLTVWINLVSFVYACKQRNQKAFWVLF